MLTCAIVSYGYGPSKSGPVAEGNVGRGTGMICHGWIAAIKGKAIYTEHQGLPISNGGQRQSTGK